jgi:hypothetical protein
MWFSVDNLVLISAQAACVAVPAVGLCADGGRAPAGADGMRAGARVGGTWRAADPSRARVPAAGARLGGARQPRRRGLDHRPDRRLGLPQLQSAAFGAAGLGYGDFFAAAVVGGILAAERGPQLAAAVGMVLVSLCWDQLFLVYDLLPATIPPAVVLAAASLWRARSQRGPADGGSVMVDHEGFPARRRAGSFQAGPHSSRGAVERPVLEGST